MYCLCCLLLVFYSASIKPVHVHRLQAYMPCTQINTHTHIPTQMCTYKIIGIAYYQVAGVAKSSSDKCFLWIIICIYKQAPFCPLVSQNTVLNFPFLDVALCWSLPCLCKSYLKNLICSITDNKGITRCMPCIFCRLFLAFVSYF